MDGTRAPASRKIVRRGDIEIEVLSQGRGRTIVLLPSLGRGAEDFEPIANALADAGYRVLRPQPRGIGASVSPRPYADLQDCASDIAAVIEDDGPGNVLMVGHAFGNRVSRMLATARPDLVRGVCLVAANVGHAPSPPKVREAIRNSANTSLPDDVRLDALRFAFFAPGNAAEPWLEGWYPDVLAAQRIAGDQTARTIDYAAGQAPLLYLQPSHDPLAHADDAREFKAALGDRVTVTVIPQASHAAIAEQPDFIAQAIADFARKIFAGSCPLDDKMSESADTDLILRTTATSPFGRKVKIGAHATGLWDRIQIQIADPWSDTDSLRAQNPLGKMPALILPDGRSIYDSPVILDYLDMIAGGGKLIPSAPRARLEALTFQALGDGMIDAGLIITYETKRRPEAFCYGPWIDHQRGKLERGLRALAASPPDPARADVGSISVACALGYLDWRKQIDWRELEPSLVDWLDAFARTVPSFEATRGVEH